MPKQSGSRVPLTWNPQDEEPVYGADKTRHQKVQNSFCSRDVPRKIYGFSGAQVMGERMEPHAAGPAGFAGSTLKQPTCSRRPAAAAFQTLATLRTPRARQL